MEFEEVIKSRKAVRDYLNKEISDEQLHKLFELVRLTPSGYNLQPWNFIIVRTPENKKLLRKCANGQSHVEEASATIILLGNTNPLAYSDDVGIDPVKKPKIVKMAARTKEERISWAHQNVNLAAMNLMLAAQSIGLATCPIGAFDEKSVREHFNVPDDFEIPLLITLGYAKNVPERRKRRNYESMVHFEKYVEKYG